MTEEQFKSMDRYALFNEILKQEKQIKELKVDKEILRLDKLKFIGKYQKARKQIKELKEENEELNNQVCSDCGSYYSETSEEYKAKQALK